MRDVFPTLAVREENERMKGANLARILIAPSYKVVIMRSDRFIAHLIETCSLRRKHDYIKRHTIVWQLTVTLFTFS